MFSEWFLFLVVKTAQVDKVMLKLHEDTFNTKQSCEVVGKRDSGILTRLYRQNGDDITTVTFVCVNNRSISI